MQGTRLELRSTTFRDHVAVARRRKWIILQFALLIPAIAVALSVRQTPLYSASADVLINRSNPAAALSGTQQSSLLADRDSQTEASLARVQAVVGRALTVLGEHDMTIQDFLDASSVTPAGNSDLLTFQLTLPSGRRAIAFASAYADQYTRYRRGLDTDALKQARAAIEHRLAELESGSLANVGGTANATPRLSEFARSALYANLVEKDEQLRAAEALSLSKFVVVRPASNAQKVQPRPIRNGLLGLVLGLVLGIGLAFFKETLDTRPRSGIEIGAELDLPLLARVPSGSHRLHKDNRLVMLAEPHGPGAEAFRILRANLELLDRGWSTSRRTLMVTSAADGEGKSTTVANLAIALAQAGRHVIVVDLDLRRPTLGRLFGLRGQVGLIDVALGHVPVEQALAHVALNSGGGRKNGGSQPGRNGSQPHGRLELLVAGSLSVEPGDFLSSDGFATTLGELRSRADVVLLDSPPLLGVGDALLLSARVDELIVVSRLGRSRLPTINELRGVLGACRAKKLGVVLTGVDPRQIYGDPPAYRVDTATGKPQEALVS